MAAEELPPTPPPSEAITELKASGNAHLKAGRIDAARTDYSAALALDPSRKHPDAAALLSNRALTQLKLDAPESCKEDCTAALALKPDYGKAYYRRALAHEATGALADAFKDVRQLMRYEPGNKEAVQLAAKLKQAMEKRAASSDLSTPLQAVETLRTAAADSDAAVQAAGKLSRIAEDGGRSMELLHAGAVDALVSLLPKLGAVEKAADIQMPLVGLAIEALDRMGGVDQTAVLKAIAHDGETLPKVRAVAKAAALAQRELGGDAPAVVTDGGAAAEGEVVAEKIKNLLLVSRRALSIVSSCAGSRSAVGSQTAQGNLVTSLLPYIRHAEPSIAKAGQDCLVRVVNQDAAAAGVVLPAILKELIWLLGDEEAMGHRVALGVLSKLMGKEGGEKAKKAGDDENEEDSAQTKALCKVCADVLSPILRSDDAEWAEHVAAIHGVTAVLEVNKAVGNWLLRQESIFWSLAEVAEMDDEDLQKSLAEVYAHAANDPQHFRDKAGDEPLRNLKAMLKSPKPRVRCRACVALAKTALIHQSHRVDINPTGKLLTATLGLLEAKVPASVHRWAVEAFMYLTVLQEVKAHLIEAGVQFGSMVALAESVSQEDGISFALVQAFRRLCVAREKSDDQKRLETEMNKEQIEQMRQLSAGGMGAAPTEMEDDPETLRKLAYRLVQDDAALVISEVVAHAKSDVVRQPCAEVLLQMTNTQEARGKLVQQGGFKALIALSLCDDEKTKDAAAWALAKIGISINPALYPRRTGSGPEAMVAPLVRLVDSSTNELQTFEACMALCNLATVDELRDRIVAGKGWRVLEMALTSDNELVQRAAVECMSNLVTHDEIAEKFTSPTSTATKIFVGFASSDDTKMQIAATGGIATLATVDEISTAFVQANVLEALVEIALIGEEPAVIHRAAVALQRLLATATDAVIGPVGGPLPDHAMLALGALSSLASDSKVPQARQAAQAALEALDKARPEMKPPPPQLVAEAVAKLQAEHDARIAEQEAAEAAAEEEEARAAAEAEEAAAAKVAKREAARAAAEQAAKEGNMPVVEEVDEDDDDDDLDGVI